ncbi:MAG: cysteine-rich small domain-containing protein, partial [Dissulfurispiraceae bacterium]
ANDWVSRRISMNYKYFIHQDCAFYPCHNLREWESCLFCWCPLFLLDCGGDFVIKGGIKDCFGCSIPHTKEGYDYVLEVVRKEIYCL